MSVSLTISKTIAGSAASDSLTGGATGYDWGETETGDASPPEHTYYVRHDGTQEITNFALNIQPMSGTYGGDYNASADLAKLIAHGDAGDYGMQWDFRWDASPTFASGQYTIFKTGVGVSFATRVTIPVTAMSRNDGGTEVDAVSPVAGKLGPAASASLGDRAHMTMRYKTPASETATGRRQVDVYYSYNFTS